MSEGNPKTQPAAQAGWPGKTTEVGLEVGGVHSSNDASWLDLWALAPETRAYLKATAQRNAACPQARQRSEGAGDGSKEITTPQKLRKLQRALYRKAKGPSECLAMKRLGKPDTGNPSVRFDEGSESVPGTDNYGRFNPFPTASGLLYYGIPEHDTVL